MSNESWHVSGEYFESCSCDFMCPCVASNLTARPTQGHCDVALLFHVEHGHFGAVSLDDLSFVVVIHTPGVMSQGDWTAGLIIDERASEEQTQALIGIGSGQAGGPMAVAGPLISTFAGVERGPIEFRMDGLSRSVSVPGMLDQAINGIPSLVAEGQTIVLDNGAHPPNKRLALATAERSHFHVFGIDWDETSGKNNGHFAPFNWSG